ncbi:MAG: protein kinase [Blastocatellia bacterium]|nr:protein kinase [Blastocatellia bacterium]
MTDHDLTGQILDGKYQMTRELGKGGMGTVYLATHLGTERPVAVKIIAPQFMQRAEFVERFRREAKAAGRLRHPNVVDVTDFGFAATSAGEVAYLVMEYLDGCTLGEILDEENNLPVGWTLDILEQVCSAVQEAHNMGIIHRDLKPDNIWLEPNQRGGYTVKVLDFGIAKLEEHEAVNGDIPAEFLRSSPTQVGTAKTTFGGVGTTMAAEASTIVQTIEHNKTVSLEPIADEKKTAIYDQNSDQDTVGTQLLDNDVEIDPDRTGNPTGGNSLVSSLSTAGLTRVGAVLGTPLYMSPEQCRGEHLDARSDIYSLGVIAYQMLSGRTPFEGDFKAVMESHKTIEPPPLAAKNVRRKMRRVIHDALSKDPAHRPQTAEAFASELRSREEGIYGLVSRAMVIYSQHLLKFLTLTAFLFIPPTFFTIGMVILSFLRVSESIPSSTANVFIGVLGIGMTLANAFCGSLIVGTIAWIVTQNIAVPLRPIRLRPALREAKKKWKRFAGAGALSAILPFVACGIGAIGGFIVLAALLGILYPLTESVGAIFIAGAIGSILGGVIGFFYAYTSYMLVAPSVMMENVGIIEAFRRSRQLVKRSFTTAAGAAILMFLIPAVTAGSISYIVNVSARAFDPESKTSTEAKSNDTVPTEETSAATQTVAPEGDAPAAPTSESAAKKDDGWNWSVGPKGKDVRRKDMDMRSRVRVTLLESLINILWLPMQIFVFSFSGIIVALLYLKTRLAGGESMQGLIERFEDDEKTRKKWQERVRQRLIQSGRLSGRSSQNG